MLKELFDSIVTQAHKSKEPEQPKLIPELSAKDGRDVAFVYNGQITHHLVAAPPRKYVAATAASFAEILIEYCHGVNQLLLVSKTEVTAWLDKDRRDSVTLPLPLSAHIESLVKLPKQMDQRTSIAFLRKELFGTGFDNYAESLRNVVFDRSRHSAGVLTKDQESMGRSVEAKVSGTKDMPEILQGHLMVFDPSVFRAQMPFDLGCEARLMDELFEFWLPPDAIETAINAGLTRLVEYLEEMLPEATVIRGCEE